MKRLGGPQIKVPDVKVPPVLRDLYADLRDRRLLPVVVLLVVTIVAAPILIGNRSGSEDEEPVATPATAAKAKASDAVVVTASTPGLRRYQRRLGHLHADDPFRPKLAPLETTEGPGETSTPTGGSKEVLETPPATEATGGTGGEGAPPKASGAVPSHPEAVPHEPSERAPGASPPETSPAAPAAPGSTKIRYFTYAIDVRVVSVSAGKGKGGEDEDTQSAKQGEPQASTKRNLPPLTMLPGRKTPALTYIGPSKDGKKAVMLVADEVSGLFGEATCVEGSAEHCQLLALEPGLPETIVYGPAERTYRIELLKIQMLYTKKLNRAPLGEPKKGKGKKSGANG